jgi:hypothetical protein
MTDGMDGGQMSDDENDSGTGWPGAPTEPLPATGSSTPTQTMRLRDERDDDVDRPERGQRRSFLGRWFGRMAFLAIAAAALVIVLVATNLVGFWHFSNPFSSRKTDRSQPTLLLSIQDLARFEAASGNFQVIIDVQEDKRFIPDIIFSKRSLFVAAGSVDAYVDFSNIAQKDLQISADRKTVTIHLPAPQLEPARLDVSKSYVYAEQEGLINKLGDLFGGDPNKLNELYQLAEQKIQAAATDSGLQQRASDNTKDMLTQLLKSLGYTNINIDFASP